ncbi:MAG: hypothetical protein J6Q65_04230 [Lentisphaeria bacterium]|nr:hypothetical protein [Lentisphaeria bacterium]
MIRIDIPLPETCEECPCSYWIQSGADAGKLMCNALEFAGNPDNLVEEGAPDRPDGCPIIDD